METTIPSDAATSERSSGSSFTSGESAAGAAPGASTVDRAAQRAHETIDRVAAKAGPAVERVRDAANSAARVHREHDPDGERPVQSECSARHEQADHQREPGRDDQQRNDDGEHDHLRQGQASLTQLERQQLHALLKRDAQVAEQSLG